MLVFQWICPMPPPFPEPWTTGPWRSISRSHLFVDPSQTSAYLPVQARSCRVSTFLRHEHASFSALASFVCELAGRPCSRRFVDRASYPHEDLDPHRDHARRYRSKSGSFVTTKIRPRPSDPLARKNSHGKWASEIDPVDGTGLGEASALTDGFETIVLELAEVGRRHETLCTSRLLTMQATSTRCGSGEATCSGRRTRDFVAHHSPGLDWSDRVRWRTNERKQQRAL